MTGSPLSKLLDKAVTVIIGFLSNFVFGFVRAKPNSTELSLIIVLAFALWTGLDPPLRRWLRKIPSLKRDAVWRRTLEASLDFVWLLGVFLVVQLSLQFFLSAIGTTDPNFDEIVVGLAAAVLVVFGFVQSLDELRKDDRP